MLQIDCPFAVKAAMSCWTYSFCEAKPCDIRALMCMCNPRRPVKHQVGCAGGVATGDAIT